MGKKQEKNSLTYKGYSGSIEVSVEDECLHGRILYIDDIVTYEGGSVPEITSAFVAAVDRYIEHCERTGLPAEKPCSGTFNVRIGPGLHKDAVMAARRHGTTLNDFVVRSIQAAIDNERITRVEHMHQHNISITWDETHEKIVTTADEPAKWGTVSGVH